MLYSVSIKQSRKDIDPKKYQEKINQRFLEIMTKSAQAFVEEAAPRVPVDTGMARGTFLNVSRALKIPFITGPRNTQKKWYEDPFRGQLKSPRLGTKYSSYKIPTKTKPFEFRIGSDLLYFWLWSVYGFNGQPAWETFEAGRKAFDKTFKANIKGLFDD